MNEMIEGTMRELPQIVNVNEHHMALVFLLDTSGSMEGTPIQELNEGINAFKEQVCRDEDTKKILDVAIVEYNSTSNVIQDFVPVEYMDSVELTAGGQTFMSEAIDKAIDMVDERSRFYRRFGTEPYKPWIFLLTDGANMDDISAVSERIRKKEEAGQLKFFSVGVGDEYDSQTLHTLAGEKVLKLKNYNFAQLFDWVYKSMRSISQSVPSDRPVGVMLPSDVDKDVSSWM